MLKFLVFFLLSLLQLQLASSRSERVIKGEISKRGQFPFVAKLLCTTHDGIDETCTGSLISDQFILTAAHCVQPRVKCTIFLGMNDERQLKDPDVEAIISSQFKVHPCYDELEQTVTKDDIALIKLPEKVKLNENIQVVQLPDESTNEVKYTGRKVITLGWGKFDADIKETSSQLRYMSIKVLSKEKCKQTEMFFDREVLCGRGIRNGRMTCYGDSGGPVIIETENDYVQIATNTFVLTSLVETLTEEGGLDMEEKTCVDPLRPVGMVRTSFHKKWIDAMMNDKFYEKGNCDARTFGRSVHEGNSTNTTTNQSKCLNLRPISISYIVLTALCTVLF